MQKSFALSCISLLITLLCIFCLGGCQSDFSADSTDSTTTQTIENSTERTTEPLMDETTTTLPQAEELTTPPVAEESTTEPITEETSTETEEKPVVPEKPLELKQNTYHFCKNRENFKRFGRMVELTDGLTCDFTASGVEFWGRMQGNVTVSLSCDRDTYFTVFIDGVRVEERFYATPTTKELCIASFEDGEEHTIRFLKQTEAQWSLCVLESVSITGFLFPAPENREFLIEFIGDSITCGWGTIGEHGGAYTDQDGTLAYPYLVAQALNADYSMTALSGQGLLCGDPGVTNGYLYADPRGNSDIQYDFARKADVVVINIGTNDYWNDGVSSSSFRTAYLNFLRTVREKNGDECKILCLYNTMNDTYANAILSAVKEFGGELEGVSVYKLNRADGNHHPNAQEHIAYFNVLKEIIPELPGKFIPDITVIPSGDGSKDSIDWKENS